MLGFWKLGRFEGGERAWLGHCGAFWFPSSKGKGNWGERMIHSIIIVCFASNEWSLIIIESVYLGSKDKIQHR